MSDRSRQRLLHFLSWESNDRFLFCHGSCKWKTIAIYKLWLIILIFLFLYFIRLYYDNTFLFYKWLLLSLSLSANLLCILPILSDVFKETIAIYYQKTFLIYYIFVWTYRHILLLILLGTNWRCAITLLNSLLQLRMISVR